jgi:inorganic triphosphatase YgiF
MMAPVMIQKAGAPSDHDTLSREHKVVIDVSETALETGFRKVVDRCMKDSDHHCTILQSDLSSGQYPSGLIKLRVDPAAVEDLVGFASGLGRLESRSTTVEDLAEAIQDTQARIEMLTAYRKQLLELRAKATTNIEAAIKIASELSTVQSDIERATGEAAFQTRRVTTDVVTLRFEVTEQRAFWRPVREAFRDFRGHLSEGMSQAITAVAYIVPWLFIVVPGLYLVRFLWRRRGR